MSPPSFGIVLQGPCTSNTGAIVERYLRDNPSTKVVVATKQNTVSPEVFDLAEKQLITLATYPHPGNLGLYNRHDQLLSAFVGLKVAKETLHLTHVAKTRTDHHVALPSFCEHLAWWTQRYPLAPDTAHQRERLCFLDYGTSLLEDNGAFHLSDWFAFGDVDDMLGYFDYDNPHLNLQRGWSLQEKSPEGDFCLLWMKKNGMAPELGFEHVLATRLLTVDAVDLRYAVSKTYDLQPQIPNGLLRNVVPLPGHYHHHNWLTHHDQPNPSTSHRSCSL